jgi:FkbM family methyltransferase
MKKIGTHIFWVSTNIYGFIFGRQWLARLHQAVIIVALHGLGYDNGWTESFTGEEWFIEHILKPYSPTTCIDVGANVGAYSDLLLKHTRDSKTKVYAIEPAQDTFEVLKRDTALTAIQAAISDYDGETSLFSDKALSPKASLAKDINSGIEQRVKVMRLDTLVAKYDIKKVDFVKIDTEGFEAEVIKGMGELRPQFIQFEFNAFHVLRNTTLYSLCNLLQGYEFYRLLPNGWIKIDPKKFVNNIFMFCNIVAVRRK